MSWTVQNQGNGTAVQPWTDRVWLSTDNVFGGDSYLGDFQRTTDVAAGDSYTNSGTVTLGTNLAAGTYFLFVQIDLYHQVNESNESNNVSTPIQVTVRKPDLVPTAFSVTTSTIVDAGQQLSLQWTVANQPASGGTALRSWYDRLYLSTDNVFGGDTYLGQFQHDGPLAAGADYTASGNVTLSTSLMTGTYYLFLQTDAYDNVSEENEDNNVFAPIEITVQ